MVESQTKNHKKSVVPDAGAGENLGSAQAGGSTAHS